MTVALCFENFKELLFTSLKQFESSLLIDEKVSSNEVLCLRLSLVEEDVQSFLDYFSSVSNTEWIVYKKSTHPEKYIYRKTWICQHSSRRKRKGGTVRNTNCQAKFDVLIKKVNASTMRNDPYLKENPPLSGKITISLNHSHNIAAADALRMLRVDSEVKDQYFQYFDNGLTAAEAFHFHETKFLLAEDYVGIANASINPTQKQVAYLYSCWRDVNVGSLINPFEKLKEKVPFYESLGTTVKFIEGECWAVLVVTALMKRVHLLDTSSQIIFVDSTSSCESTSSNLTIMVSATKVGAIPIAVLIHKFQTTENYQSAFALLKDNFPFCFGGQDHPAIFMTDDSSAEKAALRCMWPYSIQLLCHFHVAQAEWRWLFSASNKIPPEERPRLMKLFQAVMYAVTAEELRDAVNNFVAGTSSFPHYAKRFVSFLQREKEWVLFHRKDLITRNNNTNNLAEASIRILKDVVLTRTRAFNIVALTEFCVDTWEKYFVRRLLDFAFARRAPDTIMYCSMSNRKYNLTEGDIFELERNIFSVPSETNEKTFYVVNCDVGVCSCRFGLFGAFCKHQRQLMKLRKLILPNAPPMTLEDRHRLANLALGNKCPKAEFFLGLTENINDTETFNFESTSAASHSIEIVPKVFNSIENEKPTENLNDVVREIDRISELVKNNIAHDSADVSQDDLSRILRNLRQVKSISDLKHIHILKSLKINRSKIRVQPTTISRRKNALVKCTRRIASGRPAKIIKNKVVKRKRNLGYNIKENIPNSR